MTSILFFLLNLLPAFHSHTYETDDKFYNGEILLPDSLHNDVRVVINAAMFDELNTKTESWEELYDLVQEMSLPIEDNFIN